MFVDPDTPADDYTLTYNCLACPDNQKTYNDGWAGVQHARQPHRVQSCAGLALFALCTSPAPPAAPAHVRRAYTPNVCLSTHVRPPIHPPCAPAATT